MNIVETIREEILRASEEGRVDAASLHVEGVSPFSVIAGFADRAHSVPLRQDTAFHIGSVTKALTAALIWEQIFAGKLSADDFILDIVPELRRIGGLAERNVTIAQLLAHTCGIDGDVMLEVGGGADVLRRFLARIGRLQFLFEPGDGFSYSNVSYALLARAIELAKGTSFERALRDYCQQQGIEGILLGDLEKAQSDVALAWLPGESGFESIRTGPYSNIASGTQLAMPVQSLARWGMSLNRQPALLQAMTTGGLETPFSHRFEAWGRGLMVFSRTQSVYGHDGGTAGTATYWRVAPEAGASWAFSAIGDGAGWLYRKIEEYLYSHAGLVKPVPERPFPEEVDLTFYTGRYSRDRMDFDVEMVGGALILRSSGAYADDAFDGVSLAPLNRQIFEIRLEHLEATVWASFHAFDPAGRPARIQVGERSAVRQEAGS